MNDFAFTSPPQDLPTASSEQQANDGIERWLTALREAGSAEQIEKGMALVSDTQARKLLNSVFGNSHYLRHCSERDPVFALDVFTNGPDAGFAIAINGVKALQESEIDFTELARELRRAKLRAALAISIGDITGSWAGQKVTQTLTDFADSALRAACAHALREIASQGAIELQEPTAPEKNSGLIVLGMGKYGAGELNYSSDIDIIVFYDEDIVKTDKPSGLQKYFVRLARCLLGLLNERTADGYVFRTDLRLRPDPGATQLAISVKSGLTYYQKRALDWERAAMIKARAVAGDLEAGDRFLEQLEPFVWQKNLDFAAVKEIRTIKRQIDIHKGRAELRVPGHNVKLGRGGIRELEFFVQAQQLVWGGRMPEVRCRGTIDGLDALVSIGQVFKSRADELKEAYHFLRWVEHRLQMINDEQTHSIPEDESGLSQIAIFLGYESEDDFSCELMKRFELVESVFVELFDISLLPQGDAWELDENLPAAEESYSNNFDRLSDLGFSNAPIADATVRAWFSGKYPATQGQHAGEALTDLLPMLLKVFGGSMHADHSLKEFDKLLSRVPADLQFVSMLHSHPHIVGMLGNITSKAPHLIEFLCENPEALESILIYDFFDPTPSPEELHREISEKLSHARSISDASAIGRKWVDDRRFQVAVQLLGGLTEETSASHAFSRITETAVQSLVPSLISRSAGTLLQDQFVILAVGDLGSGEMTWTAPLKVVFVSADGGNDGNTWQNGCFSTVSQGLEDTFAPWSLPGKQLESQNHIRDTQHVGISTYCFEDIGNRYFELANINDLLTLTQARVIFGTEELAGAVFERVRGLLTSVKDRDKLRSDIGSQLAAVPEHENVADMWTTSTLRRELYNLELAVRYLQLSNAEHDASILDQNVRHVIEKLRGFDLLDANVANDLIVAFDIWRALLGVLDVAIGESDHPNDSLRIPDDLRPRLSQIADAPDFEACTELLRETSQSVHGHVSHIFQ